ncbi:MULTISPECIES: 50S ribosomal protein L11 methyltransferase [unclassified Aureimonas]|uniref:50S ribosomal protein L11 methyltransferase n=1 Tax=unclassified Aureimonas TaxID=2615206 RepID=UPI0006F58F4A|nr:MULTISPECIES: 50S ribosomal protein L11 methyltransferase [unclassified Aureimonas]KQT52856.1 ribosomal protein L11 methyltransferase [Aureimonas sp. Leaf427]KQT80315.1 ribosomal protein L11 methyltransferase [Aureimonas sp. Leaf460]
MTQTRYFTRAGRTVADRISSLWEIAFEDEGAPVGVFELDEAADLYEVSVYFDDEAGGASMLGAVEAAVSSVEGVSVEVEHIPETDWMKSVLEGLQPVRAGRFVVHGAHDRHRVRANDLAIEIEAGQAFGTGHHGTTSGCLTMIDRIVRRRRPGHALDLGTGSAVLAIALARLARIPVLATDIDPVAVAVARENIRANRVQGFVEAAVAVGFEARAIGDRAPYDLIVANILARPLMDLAPKLQAHLAEGGNVILSGILERQRRAVLSAYRLQGLYHRETLLRGEWVTLHLSR